VPVNNTLPASPAELLILDTVIGCRLGVVRAEVGRTMAMTALSGSLEFRSSSFEEQPDLAIVDTTFKDEDGEVCLEIQLGVDDDVTHFGKVLDGVEIARSVCQELLMMSDIDGVKRPHDVIAATSFVLGSVAGLCEVGQPTEVSLSAAIQRVLEKPDYTIRTKEWFGVVGDSSQTLCIIENKVDGGIGSDSPVLWVPEMQVDYRDETSESGLCYIRYQRAAGEVVPTRELTELSLDGFHDETEEGGDDFDFEAAELFRRAMLAFPKKNNVRKLTDRVARAEKVDFDASEMDS
jgi:hypothetical protein